MKTFKEWCDLSTDYVSTNKIIRYELYLLDVLEDTFSKSLEGLVPAGHLFGYIKK